MKSTHEILARHFGENVRRMRQKRGYSQEKLAQLCSLHRSAVNDIEQGLRLPRLDTVLKVMKVLETTSEELLFGAPVWVPGLSGSGEWVVASHRRYPTVDRAV
jgi:transcriptional regulator with XRE-family HTH domain